MSKAHFSLLLLFVLLSAKTHDVKLSGKLIAQDSTTRGDVVEYRFKDDVWAVLSLDEHIFSVFGGIVEIDGNDNDVSVSQDYCNLGVPCLDPSIFMIFVTGDSTAFELKQCKFDIQDNYTSILCASDTQQLTVKDCEVTGSLFTFARISNTKQLTIKRCSFENMKAENSFPYFSYGFVLTLTNCTEMTLKDLDFADIKAGTYDEGKYSADGSLAGYGAPVLVKGGTQVTIKNCDFKMSSGLLAGALLIYNPGVQGTYKNLRFLDNTYTLPLNNLSETVGAVPNADELADALEGYVPLGHDITRLGPTAVETRMLCSASAQPHFRNGLSLESFPACFGAGAIVATVLGSVALVATALGVLCCCCCGCCCAECYRCCSCCYCFRRRGMITTSCCIESVKQSSDDTKTNTPSSQGYAHTSGPATEENRLVQKESLVLNYPSSLMDLLPQYHLLPPHQTMPQQRLPTQPAQPMLPMQPQETQRQPPQPVQPYQQQLVTEFIDYPQLQPSEQQQQFF